MLFAKSALLVATLAVAGLAGCASDYDSAYRGYPDYYYTGFNGGVEHDNYYFNHYPGYWDHQHANDAAYRNTIERQQQYRQGLLRQDQIRENHQSNLQLQHNLAEKRAAEARQRQQDQHKK